MKTHRSFGGQILLRQHDVSRHRQSGVVRISGDPHTTSGRTGVAHDVQPDCHVGSNQHVFESLKEQTASDKGTSKIVWGKRML